MILDPMAADITSFLQRLDSQLEQLIRSWDIYSVLILIVFVSYLFYPVFFTPEPDIHPLLLARQSSASPVRHPGESATHRSQEIPYGYPLKTGLNVKDPGAPRWSGGRDGDLRDVWRKALAGPTDSEGKSDGAPGQMLSVLGSEEVIEFSFEKLTSELNAVGQHIQKHGGKRVAIYLTNSVEFFASLFGMSDVFLPTLDQSDNGNSGCLLRPDPYLGPKGSKSR